MWLNVHLQPVFENPQKLLVPEIEGDVRTARIEPELIRKRETLCFPPSSANS